MWDNPRQRVAQKRGWGCGENDAESWTVGVGRRTRVPKLCGRRSRSWREHEWESGVGRAVERVNSNKSEAERKGKEREVREKWTQRPKAWPCGVGAGVRVESSMRAERWEDQNKDCPEKRKEGRSAHLAERVQMGRWGNRGDDTRSNPRGEEWNQGLRRLRCGERQKVLFKSEHKNGIRGGVWRLLANEDVVLWCRVKSGVVGCKRRCRTPRTKKKPREGSRAAAYRGAGVRGRRRIRGSEDGEGRDPITGRTSWSRRGREGKSQDRVEGGSNSVC